MAKRKKKIKKAEKAKPIKKSERVESSPFRLEIYGILLIGFALALFLSLVSFRESDLTEGIQRGHASNWLGPFGVRLADISLGLLGIGSFALVFLLGRLGYSYLVGRRTRMRALDLLGVVLGFLSLAVMAHVIGHPMRLLWHPPGGVIGQYLGEISASFLSAPGTFLLFGLLGLIAIMLVTEKGVFELYEEVRRVFRGLVDSTKKALKHGDAGEPREAKPVAVKVKETAHIQADLEEDEGRATALKAPLEELEPVVYGAEEGFDEGFDEDEGAALFDGDWEDEEEALDAETPAHDEPRGSASSASLQAKSNDELQGLRIVESQAMKRSRQLSMQDLDATLDDELDFEDAPKPYVFPSLSMLDYKPPETATYDTALLKRNAQILEKKLLDYRVKGNVIEIHPGPVITMYEFKPAPGVKVSSIANLANDLAMALSAISIRIVAPIPGKDVVGIEIPNEQREIVWLKEIVTDKSYVKAKSNLTLALGKDIVGNPAVMDLAKAPHLLVAGATGAGKSVAINTFIVSLLFRAEPKDVRLIMVDPKMLELSIYEGIPHLLLPVVTDPTQASTALKWAVKEMERRYHLMADMGVRNLNNYNQKVDELLANPGQRLPEKLRMAKLKREAKGEVTPEGEIWDTDGRPLERLPAIVVIIDEFADLMMVASKDVEHSVARLAQMARASGIHLVLATQRPSVNVLTGLIKANFPTRISFRVASQIDSRTVLDQKGAEALLGMGDMLFQPPGSAIRRVHGCFVSEEEVHRIVDHLKEQGSPDYDMGILVSDEEEEGGDNDLLGEGDDELYDQAVKIAAKKGSISTSYLQRRLKIGYNRSARIIDQMEENGLIGPSDGTSRPREVFIDPI